MIDTELGLVLGLGLKFVWWGSFNVSGLVGQDFDRENSIWRL